MISKIEGFLGNEFKDIVDVLDAINIWEYVGKLCHLIK